MAAPENIIANELFQMEITNREEMYSRIMYTCKQVAHNEKEKLT